MTTQITCDSCDLPFPADQVEMVSGKQTDGTEVDLDLCPRCFAGEPPEEAFAPYEGPPPGTWAATAWLMAGAGVGQDDGFDWDAWKDEMKERDL